MRLPNADQARVDRAKVVNYLLSLGHEEGAPKAGFFLGFGFTRERWEDLADALRVHAASHEVTRGLETPYGVNYSVDGPMPTPDGRIPLVKTVWAVDEGSAIPRLVTAYPA